MGLVKRKEEMKMKTRFFNGEELTEESILKARKSFSDNCLACIEDVKSGKSQIYCNKNDFYEREERNAKEYLAGVNDTFTLLQRAYYFQTGESVALFQDNLKSKTGLNTTQKNS